MRRSLFGAYADHTGLIKKLVRERRWDVEPANREPLCDLSCTFGQRLFLQADTWDAFSPELPQVGSTPGWGGWSRCQRRLQQQMLEPGMLLPPHPPPGLPAAEGRTPRGSFSVPFPSQSSVFPGTTSFPCSGNGWMANKDTRCCSDVPGLFEIYSQCC